MAEFDTLRKKRDRARLARRLLLLGGLFGALAAALMMLRGGAAAVMAGQTADLLTAFLAGDSMPVTLSSDRPRWIADVSGRIALADGNSLSVYTRAGRRVAVHTLGYANPAFCASGPRVLAYDVGGNRLDLFLWGEHRLSPNGGEMILCADLAANGHVAVGGSEPGSLSGVRVYAEDGRELFTWTSGELMVSALSLSPDGDSLALAGAYVQDGELCSAVSLYRLSREEPPVRATLRGEAVLALARRSDGVVAVGTRGVSLLGGDGALLARHDYTAAPDAFALSDSGEVALLANRFGDALPTLTLLGPDLRELGQWSTGANVAQIGFGRGGLFALADEQLSLYVPGAEPATLRLPEAILAVPGDTVYYASPTQLKKADMPR